MRRNKMDEVVLAVEDAFRCHEVPVRLGQISYFCPTDIKVSTYLNKLAKTGRLLREKKSKGWVYTPVDAKPAVKKVENRSVETDTSLLDLIKKYHHDRFIGDTTNDHSCLWSIDLYKLLVRPDCIEYKSELYQEALAFHIEQLIVCEDIAVTFHARCCRFFFNMLNAHN